MPASAKASSSIAATAELRRPVGDRITSIRYAGHELGADETLSLCLNNYRASGAGGYGCYAHCETLREQSEEISEQIIAYVDRHRNITVDRTRWLTVKL